jgi:hypothetical protein
VHSVARGEFAEKTDGESRSQNVALAPRGDALRAA